MYRPEGWENDYCTDRVKSDECLHTEIELHSAFEAGADAMLEGLKKEGSSIATGNNMGYLFDTIPKETKGYLVFIPEVKE